MNFSQIKPVLDSWSAEVKTLLDCLINVNQDRIIEIVTRKIKARDLDSDTLDQVYSYLFDLEQELRQKDEKIPHRWFGYGFEPNSTDLPFDYSDDPRFHIYILYDRDLVEEACSYEDGILALEIGFRLSYYYDDRHVSREDFISLYGDAV